MEPKSDFTPGWPRFQATYPPLFTGLSTLSSAGPVSPSRNFENLSLRALWASDERTKHAAIDRAAIKRKGPRYRLRVCMRDVTEGDDAIPTQGVVPEPAMGLIKMVSAAEVAGLKTVELRLPVHR